MAMLVFCALTSHKIYDHLTRHLRLDTTLVVNLEYFKNHRVRWFFLQLWLGRQAELMLQNYVCPDTSCWKITFGFVDHSRDF